MPAMLREHGRSLMNATLIKALVVLVPGAMLLARSIVLFRRERTLYPLLQLVGAASSVVVVLTHVFEALGVLEGAGGKRREALEGGLSVRVEADVLPVLGGPPSRL